MPESMAIAAKKYTTVGNLSLVSTVDILPVSTVTSGGSGAVFWRCANWAGDGTYFSDTNHSSTQTTAPPRAAPVHPSANATAGKKSPENSCDACTPDCFTPIQPVRCAAGTGPASPRRGPGSQYR